MVIFYKGEDIIIHFSSETNIGDYTKAVKFFTPFSSIKTATINEIDDFNFTATISDTQSSDLKTGVLNIVVEFSLSGNTIISKSVECQLNDAYVNGGARENTSDNQFSLSFNEIRLNISFESANYGAILEVTQARDEAVQAKEDAQAILDAIDNLDSIGILNASTAVATIQTGNVTLTATPPTAWLNGQSVTVTTQGNISFAGINFTSGTTLYVGDELRKRGTQWELIKLDFSTIYAELLNRIYVNTGNTNYLNLTTSQQGKYLSGTGTLITTTSNLAVSDFIEWGSNTQFVVALNGGTNAQIFNICQYDASKNFVTGSYAGADIFPPAKATNAVYFRITYRPNLVNQLNFGTTVLAYEVWYAKKLGNKDVLGNTAVYKPDVKDVDLLALLALKANSGGSTKTIAQIDSQKASLAQGVSYDTQSTTVPESTNKLKVFATNKYLSGTGTLLDTASNLAVTDFISWGTATAFVVALNAGTNAQIFNICQYDSSQVFIAGSYAGADIFPPAKYAGAVFFRITYRPNLVNQLNLGSTILPYEAYYPASTINKKIGNKDAEGTDATFKPDVSDSALVALLNALAQKGGSTKTLKQVEDDTNATINNNMKLIDGVWVSYIIKTVKKDGTGNFTNIMQAVASITDASPSKRYEIQIFDDHYAYQKADFTLVPSTGDYYALAHTKDYVKLRGIGEMKLIYAELPATGITKTEYEKYETMHYDGCGEIENLRIVAKNIRYPVHYEQGNGVINQNAKAYSRDYEVEHLGCEEVDISVRWMGADAWGEGTTSGVQHIHENAKIIGARHGFRSHSNTLSTFPNRHTFINSFVVSKLSGGKAFYLDNLGFLEKRTFNFSSTQIAGEFFYNNDVSSLPPALLKKVIPSIRIKGISSNPTYFNNQQNVGTVLRVKSNTTGNSSVVKVVQDDAGLFGRKTEIVGTIGLKGQVYGDEELIAYGTDRRNIIGHRLGDCRTTNKLLVLNIDGTNRTVTFADYYSDANYTTNPLISNATILASINSQLSGYAVADYFAINAEYYPEFSDVLFYRANTSTTNYIPKGSFVKFVDTNRCRIATTGEIPDGFAIDDIPVSSTVMQLGRIIKNCIVSNTGRFAPTISGTFAEGDRFKLTSTGILIVDNSLQDSFAIAIASDKILIK